MWWRTTPLYTLVGTNDADEQINSAIQHTVGARCIAPTSTVDCHDGRDTSCHYRITELKNYPALSRPCLTVDSQIGRDTSAPTGIQNKQVSS